MEAKLVLSLLALFMCGKETDLRYVVFMLFVLRTLLSKRTLTLEGQKVVDGLRIHTNNLSLAKVTKHIISQMEDQRRWKNRKLEILYAL